MKKTNFDPKKMKSLLEFHGHGRITDKELAQMWQVNIDTIQRWKKKSPVIFDKIYNSGISFNVLLELSNETAINVLDMHQKNIKVWDKKRPNILIKADLFFKTWGFKFEDIYEN